MLFDEEREINEKEELNETKIWKNNIETMM